MKFTSSIVTAAIIMLGVSGAPQTAGAAEPYAWETRKAEQQKQRERDMQMAAMENLKTEY